MNFASDNIATLYALVGVFMFGAVIVNSERIAEAIMRIVN